MTALARVRHRRMMVMLSINLVALLALASMGYAGYRALRRYEGGKNVSMVVQDLPTTPVGMLATVDDAGELTTVTVFVLEPTARGGVGGSIVSVPVSSDTALGIDNQRVPLTEVYRENGADSLAASVESVLSITIDQYQVATAPEAAKLLAAIAPVKVDFPSDVVDTESGKLVTLFDQGEHSLSAAQVVQALDAAPTGSLERTRRPNVQAIWAGVVASIGDGRTQAPGGQVGSLDSLLQRLFAGPVQARGLATIPLTAKENPEGKDVMTLDRADAVWVFASIAPSSTSAPTTGLVYRVEAPPGYDAQVKYAITLLLYFGYNVQSVWVDSSVPAKPATEVELYDASFKERTAKSDTLFGEIVYVTPKVRISGVDVVLRLGTEYFQHAGDTNGSLPSTTTSTTQA